MNIIECKICKHNIGDKCEYNLLPIPKEYGCENGKIKTTIMRGKDVKEKIIPNLIKEIGEIGVTPKLAIVVAENYNPSSTKYINNKCKMATEIGIETIIYNIKWECKTKIELEKELINLITDLNIDNSINGIIVQLPFPLVDEDMIANLVAPKKDVDGFSAINLGYLMRGELEKGLLPCTPLGALLMLDHNNIDVVGKKCVIVGRSNIVGKPMAQLLINKGATVVVCNSKTKNLVSETESADILFLATGNARMFDWTYLSPKTTVIDFGINFDDNDKLCGDLNEIDANDFVRAYTPTPGGTGITTVLALMTNTVKALKMQKQK